MYISEDSICIRVRWWLGEHRFQIPLFCTHDIGELCDGELTHEECDRSQTEIKMKIEFDTAKGHSLSVKIYRQVSDLKTFRETVGQDVALINPLYILDGFQLAVAANRALHADLTGTKTTKNIHSELIFTLSGSRNVSHLLYQGTFS